MFRFGAKLRLALETLGLTQPAGALLLPPPLTGRLQPVDRPRHLSLVPALRPEVLAAEDAEDEVQGWTCLPRV